MQACVQFCHLELDRVLEQAADTVSPPHNIYLCVHV